MKRLYLFVFYLSLVLLIPSCGKSKEEIEKEKNYEETMDALQKLPKYETRNEVCPDCRGTGKTNCSSCGGDGKIGKMIENADGSKMFLNDIEMCSNCNGFGYFVCSKCGGNGVIKVETQY